MSEETKADGSNPNDANFGGFINCPRCGFDTRSKLIPVKEEDKQEYIRNLLAGTAFSKEYSMFDGKLTIKFKDLTVAESDKLMTLLHSSVTDPLFLVKGSQVKVLFSIDRIKKDSAVRERESERLMALKDMDEALAMYREVLGGYPDGVASMITSTFNIFSQELFQILNGALDKNF